MVVSIRSLETVVPATLLGQPAVRDLFLRQPGVTRLAARMIRSVFDASAIDTRHTVLAELVELADGVAGTEGDGQFRLVFNTGREAGQSVFHVHGHVLGGTRLGWSPA